MVGRRVGQEVEWLFQPPLQPRRIKMSTFDHADAPAASEHGTAHMVFELSKANWKIGVLLPGSPKLSRFTVKGGDVTALSGRLASLRAKAERCGKPVRILSCYEAGLDGHWLHRWLTEQGVISHEVDPPSIEVSRGARASKD